MTKTGEYLATKIKVIKTCSELVAHVRQAKSAGKTIGVVPTMGALHKGHVSLAVASKEATDETIATIYVNPTQFAPGEDLDKYPRTLESDLEMLESVGVDVVFVPTNEEMYPPNCSTTVTPAMVAKPLEGEFRPTHFTGVATLVLKMLNLTSADKAFFGQKDFQQVMVVKRMVADLSVQTEIVVCPTVRDPDGMAMSSRNRYLSDDERQRGLMLSKTIKHAENQIREGERDGFALITEMRQMLIDGGVDTIDYAVVANPMTLEAYDEIKLPVVALIAAHVGKTRLIDNVLILDE